jgi:hypothetical protein
MISREDRNLSVTLFPCLLYGTLKALFYRRGTYPGGTA